MNAYTKHYCGYCGKEIKPIERISHIKVFTPYMQIEITTCENCTAKFEEHISKFFGGEDHIY